MDALHHAASSRPAFPSACTAPADSSRRCYLDADFLLGPEAAHLNITGVSGLATKTSAVEFLLSSIFQTFPAHTGTVAAVCFNVKGPDLCFLDQPGEISDRDQALYARLGLPPSRSRSVRYFAPYKADGVNLNTLRTHPSLAHEHRAAGAGGCARCSTTPRSLLNRDDIDAKADAFIDFLAERVVGKEFRGPVAARRSRSRSQSFADLEEFFRAIFDFLEGRARGGEVWRTHHIATIRKVRNRLGNISTRCQGAGDRRRRRQRPAVGQPSRTAACYVVDVAGRRSAGAGPGLRAHACRKLREHLERRDLGVEHVVVFVDELNKYAPADGPDTYVRQMLLDLSERGRYLGLVLFSAQQFRSQVHRRVVGNAGTAVYGRMDMDELATPGYATLSPATQDQAGHAAQGRADDPASALHPADLRPVSRGPAVLTGREGVERFPPEPDAAVRGGGGPAARRSTAGSRPTQVRALVEGRPEDDVRRALALTRTCPPGRALRATSAAKLGRRIGGELGDAAEHDSSGPEWRRSLSVAPPGASRLAGRPVAAILYS